MKDKLTELLATNLPSSEVIKSLMGYALTLGFDITDQDENQICKKTDDDTFLIGQLCEHEGKLVWVEDEVIVEECTIEDHMGAFGYDDAIKFEKDYGVSGMNQVVAELEFETNIHHLIMLALD
ncbi:hypothetical protein I3271_09250 [Photobacterium leiognathi]|uniref:hypothetical protein n=1 Tax=Photobacterium leiognathi TaxID=553611 RepID=UPI001EDE0A22|nr:hypothetical protein [Photobacterium leiognathi]MCG3884874.1 hypothetical protein [Photobacterium leiognathi]